MGGDLPSGLSAEAAHWGEMAPQPAGERGHHEGSLVSDFVQQLPRTETGGDPNQPSPWRPGADHPDPSQVEMVSGEGQAVTEEGWFPGGLSLSVQLWQPSGEWWDQVATWAEE